MKKSMLKMAVMSAVLSLCVVAGAFAQSGNLLVNGDANNGVEGWSFIGTKWAAVTSESGMSPIDGPWFWPDAQGSSSYTMYQDVPLSQCAGRTATLSAYMHGWKGQSDTGILRLEFLSSGGSVVDSVESAPVQGHGWRQVSISRRVPASAATARVKLIGKDYSSMCDSHFDRISLVIDGVTAGGYSGGNTSSSSWDFRLEPGISIGLPSGTWTSSNSSVIKVFKNGKAMALDEGTATLTSSSGKKLVIKVEEE